jgi:aminopeptidase N
LPTFGSRGIEYPGGFFLGPVLAPVTITHEAAHEWFYGMVGDNQARDPWLDEGFATYAEAVVNDSADDYLDALNQPARVDAGTGTFADDPETYVRVVYGKGAAALLTARARAGAPAFDAAVRCYVTANAWQVATPADVASALAALPKARDALRTAGALR